MKQLIEKFRELTKTEMFILPLLNATPFLDVMGDVIVGWLLFQGAIIADNKAKMICGEKGEEDSPESRKSLAQGNKEMAFYCGKIASARFFATSVLSTIKTRCRILESEDLVPMNMTEEEFSY